MAMGVRGSEESDEAVRERLRRLLEGGLETEVEPRASDHQTILAIIARLQELDPDDLEGKLKVAGFTPYPWKGEDGLEQACETCMYYVVHRRFCELPELMLPVEPDWSCRLWRI